MGFTYNGKYYLSIIYELNINSTVLTTTNVIKFARNCMAPSNNSFKQNVKSIKPVSMPTCDHDLA